jgi:subtilisin family serine protease
MISVHIKRACLALLFVGLVSVGCDTSTQFTSPDTGGEETTTSVSNGDPIDGQFIVVYKSTKSKTRSPEMAAQITSNLKDEYGLADESILNTYDNAIHGMTAQLNDDQLNRLRNDDRIDHIEEDRVVMMAPPGACSPWPQCKNEDDGGDGGDGGTSTQETPWGIDRVGGAVDGTGLTAWVLDSGVDLDHPDLNVDVNRSHTVFTSGKDGKDADDGNGHGTHCAGTIAAIDNDQGVVGVAAGATVVGVKVLDSRGSGSYSGVIDGVDYVAANASAGDVASMSLGGPTSDALDAAIRNLADQGVYVAVAAGNDSDDSNNYSPARVEYNNVWTVSAIDNADEFAYFSNYGNPPVEFAAPGVDVKSTWKDGGYDTISGTSMATPHVAGLLLITNGNPTTDGNAIGDPDGDADPIASHN